MQVCCVSEVKAPQIYYGNNFEEKKKALMEKNNTVVNAPEKKYSKAQISGAVLAAALSAAALGGAIMHGRSKYLVNRLTTENEALSRGRRQLEEAVEEGTRRIQTLTDDNTDLRSANEALYSEIEKNKGRFQDLFEGDINPTAARERLYADTKARLENGNLGYDATEPPTVGKYSGPKSVIDKIDLPTAGTTNRASMRGLHIPSIDADGSFRYALPTSSELRVTNAESVNFTPRANQLTNVTENYADSVQWSNDKIARDVLQNFYDGHGQTLDGVKLEFTPTYNGRYRVRISGDSTYTADKAIYIGESTKRDDAKAAGNYGEGLKMAVLKLLKDGGASEVKVASDNWKVTYNFQHTDLSDKRVLAYSLDKEPKLDGNYLEFETNDRNLLESLRSTINRFYHSNNEHFKCPDFENESFGIKRLNPGEKGGIYIAGQRFEFNNNYDGLEEMVIFLKEKPPVNVMDPSRDRTSLNDSNLESLAEHLAWHGCSTKSEKAKVIAALERYWDVKGASSTTPVDKFLDRFIYYSDMGTGRFHINFPSNCVAYSDASVEVVQELRSKGYRVCKSNFSQLGMPTISDLYGDARAHDAIKPDAVQTKKLMIIREALANLKTSLQGKHFAADELDAKIFIFDNKSAKDAKLYGNASAEAITEYGTSKGFWIDKSYLEKSSFGDVLETALHELCHKVGGDESSDFSYKLTNVNQEAIKQILSDPKCRAQLQALDRIWNELSASNVVAQAA